MPPRTTMTATPGGAGAGRRANATHDSTATRRGQPSVPDLVEDDDEVEFEEEDRDDEDDEDNEDGNARQWGTGQLLVDGYPVYDSGTQSMSEYTYYRSDDDDDDDDDDDGDDGGGDDDEGNEDDSDEPDQEPAFDPLAIGLKEINNLAHFGVSSHKPGNGVDELLSDDLDKYWQSDGQQPHLLTVHFLRRVEIRAIRFYVDYNSDESYTPTNIVLYAGTGHHDLVRFAEVRLTSPIGWQDVPLADSGGGPDGHSLCCWIVQIHIQENHQNGKDTHMRGIKIFALDENSPIGPGLGVASNAPPASRPGHGRSQNSAASRRGDDRRGHGDEELRELLRAFDCNYATPRRRAGDSTSPGTSDLMREPEIR